MVKMLAVEGKLVVVPGKMNAEAKHLAPYICTGRRSPVCAVEETVEAVRTHLANLCIQPKAMHMNGI